MSTEPASAVERDLLARLLLGVLGSIARGVHRHSDWALSACMEHPGIGWCGAGRSVRPTASGSEGAFSMGWETQKT